MGRLGSSLRGPGRQAALGRLGAEEVRAPGQLRQQRRPDCREQEPTCRGNQEGAQGATTERWACKSSFSGRWAFPSQ